MYLNKRTGRFFILRTFLNFKFSCTFLLATLSFKMRIEILFTSDSQSKGQLMVIYIRKTPIRTLDRMCPVGGFVQLLLVSNGGYL